MKTLLTLTAVVFSFFGFAGGGGSDSGGGSSYSGGGYFSSSDSDSDGEFTWEGFLFTFAIFVISIPIVITDEKIREQKN